MIVEKHIEIKKSARYFTLGKLDIQTKEVWFVLHGYAQLAKNLLHKFEPFTGKDIFIVAPEGLNRFYSRGFAGSPVASWMTSEDRQMEINDYCAYLNYVFQSLGINELPHIKVNVLGFSQGVSTACRWVESNSFVFDKFILYAGEVAKEFQEQLPTKLAGIPSIIVRGKTDSVLNEEKLKATLQLYEGLGCKLIEFEGGHEVTTEMANKIISNTF